MIPHAHRRYLPPAEPPREPWWILDLVFGGLALVAWAIFFLMLGAS